MSYVSFGTDLVVAQANAADAEAQIRAIQASNDALVKRYQADLSSYQHAVAARSALLDQIAKEQAAYKSASLAYSAKVMAAQSANAGAMAGYNAALAAWQRAKQAYDAAVAQRTGIVQGNMASAAGVFRSGAPTPPDYGTFQAQGYCYTQAQINNYVGRCASSKVVVRGTDLGALALSGAGPECQWATLPVCKSMPALPANPGAQPTPPPQIAIPGGAPKKPPTRVVPPEPVPPVKPALQDVPHLVVQSDVKPKALAVGGLLALVIVGGGVAYYFSTHKKKAAA